MVIKRFENKKENNKREVMNMLASPTLAKVYKRPFDQRSLCLSEDYIATKATRNLRKGGETFMPGTARPARFWQPSRSPSNLMLSIWIFC